MIGQVTLSLESDAVRLVAFQGTQVVSWGSIALSPGLSQSNPETVGQQIDSLLRSKGIRTTQAIVDIDDPALLVRQLQLHKIPRRYLSQVVAREVEETIPFSLSEVDLFWQAFANGKGHQVLALCIPTDAIDNHVRAIKAAGIRDITVYPKFMALAYAVAERDAVLLSLEPSHTDITLVLQGLPRVIHHSLAKSSQGNRQAELQALAAEVERVVQFYQSLDAADLSSVAVVPTGGLVNDEMVADLASVFQRQVKLFKPSFSCAGDFSTSEYAVNLGLMLAAHTRAGRGSSLPRIDMLPARHQPTPFPWMPATVFTFLLSLAVAVSFLSQQMDKVAASVAVLSNQHKSLQARVRQERQRLQEVGAVEQEMERTQALAQQVENQLQALTAGHSSLVQRLEIVNTSAISSKVTLVSVTQRDNGFSLRAQALDYIDAEQYAAQLRNSGAFQEVALKEAQASAGGISFVINTTYQGDNIRAPP